MKVTDLEELLLAEGVPRRAFEIGRRVEGPLFLEFHHDLWRVCALEDGDRWSVYFTSPDEEAAAKYFFRLLTGIRHRHRLGSARSPYVFSAWVDYLKAPGAETVAGRDRRGGRRALFAVNKMIFPAREALSVPLPIESDQAIVAACSIGSYPMAFPIARFELGPRLETSPPILQLIQNLGELGIEAHEDTLDGWRTASVYVSEHDYSRCFSLFGSSLPFLDGDPPLSLRGGAPSEGAPRLAILRMKNKDAALEWFRWLAVRGLDPVSEQHISGDGSIVVGVGSKDFVSAIELLGPYLPLTDRRGGPDSVNSPLKGVEQEQGT